MVTLLTSLLGVNTVEGALVPAERLGPGVVRQVDSAGHLLVHWAEADVDAWMDPADLQPLGSNARLVSITRLDPHDNKISTRHRVMTRSGLGIEHNWTVELRARNIVRAIRSDGCAWTFDWNPILERMSIRHNVDFPPPRTDDAEALTVAELAVS
ncbi:MAG TPA: hypothetical protein VJ183_03980 [Chloroflexia bacterium]|nr:hypothetical protein [Chloroflexia bacterium]